MFGLIPREEKFFVHFREAADLLVEGAKEFKNLLAELPNIEAAAKRIQVLENKADTVTHTIIELLHKTFITPLDREDIYTLVCRMDDILDYIEAASERMFLYQITEVPPHAMELAEICLKSCEDIRFMVSKLENMKNSDEIIKHCVEVNRLENDADHVLRLALADLFKNEPDVRKLIKYKEIYELLETVTDRCEDVANVVEGIVLEHS